MNLGKYGLCSSDAVYVFFVGVIEYTQFELVIKCIDFLSHTNTNSYSVATVLNTL
jgi:hypothetical protein